MELAGKTLLVCDCEGTMPIDGARLAKACRAAGQDRIYSHLCRSQIDDFVTMARVPGKGVVVGCTQERATFDEALQEAGIDIAPTYVNIRERAGWSEEGAKALPKIAALLAEAVVVSPPIPLVTMRSDGICLVYGSGQAAVDAASQLASRMTVSLLLRDSGDDLALGAMDMMTARGRIVRVGGHLGEFEIQVDGYAAALPSSRNELRFGRASDGAAARCDVIVDLSGGDPLVPSPDRRDGYLRADPRNPVAVQRVLFDASNLVGEFEKPRYVDFHADLCAHSRSRVVGCKRCLDVCPVSAIRPDGDVVAIDPYLCGGCGSCNSVCPTGAADYAYPPPEHLMARLGILLEGYHRAGGEEPQILFHAAEKGWPIVEAMGRHGRGLPAHVIPVEVHQPTQLSLDVLLAAAAYGASGVHILVAPERRDEIGGLAQQAGIVEAVLGALGVASGFVDVLVESDPAAVEAALYAMKRRAALPAGTFLPQSEKRTNIRLALGHLAAVAPTPQEIIALPPGAPFGTLDVNAAGCTLCLACVGACPTGALGDNPDSPQLNFEENACIQCGLCVNTCPEKVIRLSPRIALSPAAISRRIIKEEEPFKCISCGKPFASRGTIEKMVATLAGRHSMFQGAAADRLRMCEDCRVIAHFSDRDAPMAGGERPRPRTTDDYLVARESGADDPED